MIILVQERIFIDPMKSLQSTYRNYTLQVVNLLISEHYAILEFMVAEGYAKDCNLRYNPKWFRITRQIIRVMGSSRN